MDHQWKVACFDLDGTLVRNTSAGHHIAKKIGYADEIAELELLYKQGKITSADFAAFDCKYYRGYSVSDIHRYLADIPTINHIGETVSYLASKGIPSLLCTSAWKFIAEYFAKRYGFVEWSGPDLFIDSNGAFTGKVQSVFDDTDKPPFVNEFCNRQNTSILEVLHIGNSRSDLPLFNQVGFSMHLMLTIWLNQPHLYH